MLAFFQALSPMHLLLLGIVALLLFGKRLPEVGRSLGRGLVEFKRGLKGMSDDIDEADEERPRRKLRPPADEDEDSYDDDPDADEVRGTKKRTRGGARNRDADADADDADE